MFWVSNIEQPPVVSITAHIFSWERVQKTLFRFRPEPARRPHPPRKADHRQTALYARKAQREQRRPGLLPARYARIDVCNKCHPHDASHPVGVKAVSPKIKTPDGLPTIEDGIITCVTCHKPHGGDLVHYTRFDFRKDLCMRCHLQKYST